MAGNRLPAGLRKVRGDWANPLFAKPRAKPPVFLTGEQRAAYEERLAELEAGWSRPVEPQTRAIEKIVDREARIAVEGDTDSNHDNMEG